MKAILIFALCLLPMLAGAYTKTGNVYYTDGSQADVASAISNASDGEIIDLPSGSFSWADSVTVTGKAITIRGQGGGGFLARSSTSHDIDTGSATWTLDTNPYRYGYPLPDFEIGETITARFAPRGNHTYMEGTVTAYSYPSLTINVTTAVAGYDSSSGVDTGGDTQDTNENNWVFSRAATTTVELSAANALGAVMRIDGTATGTVRLQDMKLDADTDEDRVLIVNPNRHPVIIQRCWLSYKSNGGLIDFISAGGVLANSSADCGYLTTWGNSSSSFGVKMQFGDVDWTHESWTEVHSMGDADTGGLRNCYIETCWFQGIGRTLTDCSNNSRNVIRYNVVNNGDIGSHGPDTGTTGVRHTEVYKNVFLFQNDGSGWRTSSQNGHFGHRGGTGCVWDNYFQDVGSTIWGYTGAEVAFRVWVTYGTEGRYGGWGSDDWPGHTGGETVYPATTDAPAPRGPGAGYIDGSRTGTTGEPIGELDPWYIWGNDTTEVRDGSNVLGFYISLGEGADSPIATNPDSYTAYLHVDDDDDGIVEGTIMYGTERPGYTAYVYPHQLAVAVGAAYGGRLRFDGTGSQPVLTDQTGSVPIKTN